MKRSESQARLASALEKRPRIDELAMEVKLPFEEITRLLYALWLLGTVGPSEAAPAPAPTPRSVPPLPPRPAPVPPPPVPASLRADPMPVASPPVSVPVLVAPSPAPSVQDARRQGVLKDWDGHRGRDAFDLLGVAPEAGDGAILSRYLDRARAWAPWDLDGEAAEKARDLFVAAARAFSRLSDPESRAALQKARQRAAAPVPPPRTGNVFAIKTDLLDPESQFKKGAELLVTGKHQQALAFLEFAADCDPQNGTYAASAAWCRYLVSNRTTGAATLAEMDDAIRIDPKCGIACFYAGEICRARGDVTRAEPYYQRAAKLMAPDRRPIDALKEMSREKR
jgi:hypothetical protein